MVGLKALEDDPPDLVVIHDGVRPIVPKDILKKVRLFNHSFIYFFYKLSLVSV